jgi:hypothetical protein
MSDVVGQQGVTTADDDYNTMVFVFQMLMQKVQTCTLVQVLTCTNDGALAPVGTISAQPLVNQMSGNRNPTPHGPIYNLLYSRVSGGDSAVILDPGPGDIGLMCFASRDLSGVRANVGPANPGSFRMNDWADGIYVMGVPLGRTPTQYVRFGADGITVVSPTKISFVAPIISLQATGDISIAGATVEVEATGTATIGGAAIVLAGPVSQTGGGASTFSGALDSPDLTSNGTNVHTHDHGPGTYVAGSTAVTGDSGPPL